MSHAAQTVPKRRIAILGGGFGALAAAFELTEQPNYKDKYEITVYQVGWRLGGKAASGRNVNPGFGGRIEEHGMHVFFGFYENLFYLLQRVYAALQRPKSMPLHTWQQGFRAMDNVVWVERIAQELSFIPFPFARLGGQPGTSARRLREWRLPGRQNLPPTTLGLVLVWIEGSLRQLLSPRLQVSFAARLWRLCVTALGALLSGKSVKKCIDSDTVARRLWAQIRLGFVVLKGLWADDVIHRDFDALDDEELQAWLARHGASQDLLDAPFLRAAYDAAFGFSSGHLVRKGETLEPSIAAGTALRGCPRAYSYRGAALWRMSAGTGDVVFMPLYEALRARDVKFRFFHAVTDLHLSGDGRRVEQIKLRRQVDMKNGRPQCYAPGVRIKQLACWPSEPNWDQIANSDVVRDELQRAGTTLEDPCFAAQGQPDVVLEYGTPGEFGFEDVVLGISVGGLRPITAELMDHNPAWRRMVDGIPTTATQAFQLWLNTPLAELGWTSPNPENPMVAGLIEPIDTWLDMTHLCEREDLKDARCVAYFCGPFAESSDDPRSPLDRARAQAREFLASELPRVWPVLKDRPPDALDALLVTPESHRDAPLDAQHWRANAVGSERYVQSSPRTIRFRLRADQSGFDNLVLAGDWTNNGLNMGCAESAVMSGMQAAQTISRRDPRHRWITVWGEPRRFWERRADSAQPAAGDVVRPSAQNHRAPV